MTKPAPSSSVAAVTRAPVVVRATAGFCTSLPAKVVSTLPSALKLGSRPPSGTVPGKCQCGGRAAGARVAGGDDAAIGVEGDVVQASGAARGERRLDDAIAVEAGIERAVGREADEHEPVLALDIQRQDRLAVGRGDDIAHEHVARERDISVGGLSQPEGGERERAHGQGTKISLDPSRLGLGADGDLDRGRVVAVVDVVDRRWTLPPERCRTPSEPSTVVPSDTSTSAPGRRAPSWQPAGAALPGQHAAALGDAHRA